MTPWPVKDRTVKDAAPSRERPVMSDRMLQFFECDHLPLHLREVSSHFRELAIRMVANLPVNAERTAGLRKLLEAKDCAVRALLYKEPAP